jgi:hypothetical protein
VGDHLVVTWMDFNREQIALRRYDGVLSTIADVSITGQRPWLDAFRSTGNRALIFWREGSPGGNQQQYSAAYDGALRTLAPPTYLATVDNTYPRISAAAFAIARDGTVAWAQGTGQWKGPVARTLALSEDGGAHFFVPQPLQLMASSTDDDLVPHIAVTAAPAVYVAWQRHEPAPSTYVARGVPTLPCALP